MTYKIILEDGEELGKYSKKKSPAQVAKCAMRVIYQKTGANTKDINFVNTETGREYTYRCNLDVLCTPEIIKVGGKIFYKNYIINAKRI